MSVVSPEVEPHPRRTRSRPPLWRDVRVLRATLQVGCAIGIVLLLRWLLTNLTTNLDRLGIRRDFGFLDQPAGFRILGSDFAASGSIREALLVGLVNSITVAVIGMGLALVLGVVVGVARLSSNWLVARTASMYVELLRNIPPLVLIVFGYLLILETMPRIEDARLVGNVAIVSNRGVWLPWFEVGDGAVWLLAAIAAAVAAALGVSRWRTARFDATGAPPRRVPYVVGTLLVGSVGSWWLLDPPVTASLPVIDGRIIEGGLSLYPEYLSLLLALVLYAASFIAEIVRGSIQAVHRGQSEAADALGLSPSARMRYVILPQALRIATPATGNEFLNLTKNVSLGVAVGFAELLRVAQTATGNGQPAPQLLGIVLAGYLLLSLAISAIVNRANRRLQLVER